MTQPTHSSVYGVKRTRLSTLKTSPGERASMQYDTFEHQQVTVCDTRSKVRIATWNVRTMHQPGKRENIEKGSKSYESGYTRSRRSEMAEVREITK